MVKILKRSELAKALAMGNASISMAVKNKVLIPNENGRIDIEKPANSLWIEKQKIKGKDFDLNRIYDKQAERKNPEQKTESNKGNSEPSPKDISIEQLRALEIKQKKATLLRTQKAIKLDELKIQKQEGQVIPYDAVKTVFHFAIETFFKTFEQETDSMANIFIARLGGEHKHFIEIKKDMRKKLELIKDDAIESMIVGADGIVAEYSETRGKGEKK